jgi:hypothetical protein
MHDRKRLCISGDAPIIQGGGSSVTLMSYAGASDYAILNVDPYTITAKVIDAYGSGDTLIFTGSELELTKDRFYCLADSVELVGRNGMTIQTVGGYIDIPDGQLRTTKRVIANGGIQLANGGQITGRTTTNQEIVLVQMSGENHTFFGFGSYKNQIGKTYLDGHDVNIRSNGAINMFGGIELYRSAPYIDFHFESSTADYTSRIIESANGDLRLIGSTAIILQLENVTTKAAVERVGLYASSNSAYSGFFRPLTDAKCTLGIAANRWYAVYANNATIQTSDRREKENIIPLGTSPVMMLSLDEETPHYDIHSELFDRLQPVQYNFIDGNGRICFGLIAQDVLAAMDELGIGEDELDLVHHEFWPDEETGEEKETFGLAYANLIAMLIHEVQKLKAEVHSLKVS